MTLTDNNIVTFDDLGKLGRLGNQLFQIAAVVGIARQLGYEPVFPEFENSKYFKGVFKKQEFFYHNKCLYREPYFHFQEFDLDEVVFHFENKTKDGFAPNRLNLFGYFQSEKYFENCKKEVLELFEFEDSLRKKCESIYNNILQTNRNEHDISICALHIRFGDYLLNKNYYTQLTQTHYYLRAINHICNCVIDGKRKLFLVFSDDKKLATEYMENNFQGAVDYVIINNLTDVEEFCLQSLCDNFITANSSYSWWASYLSKNENKTVIAPKSWFGVDAVGLNTKDLYRKDMVLL